MVPGSKAKFERRFTPADNVQMWPRYAYQSTTLLISGSAVGLAAHFRSSALRKDSNNDRTQWPKTRPVIASRPTEASHEQREDTRGVHSVEDTLNSRDEDVSLFEDDDSAAWANFSSRFTTARKSITAIPWSKLGDKIADQMLPEWAQALPDYVSKLQREMEMGPESLAEEVWQDAQDPDLHPHIQSNARVRISQDLCTDELAFLSRRKRYTTHALAKYLDLPEDEIDPLDVPTIAVCGSGGGLRALVAGTASYFNAQEAGLFDCATYTAGVSGSCWLQSLYYSTLGGRRHDKILQHLKHRIGVHIAYPPSFLELFTRAPTNKYLLSGSIEKLKGDPKAEFGLVDVYGLLLASRLLVPRYELGVDDRDLKLSNQRAYLANGENPLPIYAAVRHEIPIEELKSDDKNAKGRTTAAVKEKAKREAWFQWFEFTPYELWCEDFNAGIPAWSIGRRFSKGINVLNNDGLGLPELGIPLMMGIWGSAFCATLAHYYKEVRPVIKGLGGFGGIDGLIEDRNDEMIKMHPIDPGAIPNYAIGLQDRLPRTCPKSIFKDDYLELMDAGMSNNLPIYPLLRKGRDVDIIVCFDASADIKQENWLSVVDAYAKRRGFKGWPIGAGWPKTKDETKIELDAADVATAQQAAGNIAEAREKQRESHIVAKDGFIEDKNGGPRQKSHTNQSETDLGYCNIWVGNTMEGKGDTEPPESKRVDPDTDRQLLGPAAGIAVVYFPLLPNPKVEGVDPDTSPYLSTWNFIYTPEEIDKVVALARANFEEGKEQTKRTVRAVYQRKKAKRIQAEEKKRIRHWKEHWEKHGDHFQ